MPDIKDLLDSIIKDTDKSYEDKHEASEDPHPMKFDKVNFREKLSLYVLKDLISAMMHDETKDLDGMIDSSIMRHINHNYGGSCYDYLKSSCKNLQSPLIGDIIMEINEQCDKVEQEVCLTKKEPDYAQEAALKTKELLKNCENYEEFRQNLMRKVSRDIVDDVTNVIVNGNEAPVFDDLDESLNKKSKEKKEKEESEEEKKDEQQENGNPQTQDQQQNQSSETPAENMASESVIIQMCGEIVTECAIQEHRKMSVEEGMNRAIIEYCIVQMDGLFKQNPKQDALDKYIKYKNY